MVPDDVNMWGIGPGGEGAKGLEGGITVTINNNKSTMVPDDVNHEMPHWVFEGGITSISYDNK
ncbi:hypothetical protein PHLCEN_2v10308 [Hermanssonia centrifuga]|uniref:Uncharacterized protein n=1 Tax=Hermanssonia centrifuga TaxID=98765 RepID=A0A2R6NNA4_9APHY|nr:hypothetical protein PHLCEN_2v10308 [Hermanssonia centrifuga]